MPRRRAVGHAFAVLAAVDMDRLPDARRYLDMQLGAFGDRPVAGGNDVCCHAGAVLRWHEGDRAVALEDLQVVAFRLLDTGFRPYAAFSFLDLAELAGHAHDAKTATAAATALADIADRLDRDLYRALAALASAWAALAEGASTAAAAAAGEAVSLLRGLGYPAFSGRAHDALGRALAAVDRPRAREAFTVAADIFDGCGASRRRDQALTALRRMGGVGARGRAATNHGPAALTQREREVARLAAQGRAALEIAQELFIGERTVESHPARIYAKLGITSKLELVQRATELGLERSEPDKL
jgi:DNA-binding CsgD family transcriptional regulator